jgi:hypothetical protein
VPLDPLQEWLLTAHPNPERNGCPSENILRQLATKQLPADHPAVEHLDVCSPCYSAFKVMLDARRLDDKIRLHKTLMAACAGVITGLVIVWLLVQNRDLQVQLTAVQRHPANLGVQGREPNVAAPAVTGSPGLPIRSISLLPGLSRRGESSARATVVIPPESALLLFLLTHEEDRFPHYDVVLQNPEGTVVARSEGIKGIELQHDWAVPVIFASQLFDVGDYALILRSDRGDEKMHIVQVYDFSVVK